VRIVRGKKEERKSIVTVFFGCVVAVFEYYTQVIRYTYRASRARRATIETVGDGELISKCATKRTRQECVKSAFVRSSWSPLVDLIL